MVLCNSSVDLRTMGQNISAYSFASGLVLLWSAVMMTAESGDLCLTDDNCNDERSVDRGRRCVRLYDGCTVGLCMCRSRYPSSLDATGRCRDLRSGLERCDDGGTCHTSMACREGQCQCVSGRLTTDGQYCLDDHQKLLNDNCRPGRDVCLQRGVDGYTRNDVNCTRRRHCECHPGFKSDGVRCKRWNIDEHGCRHSHHCTGGAICRRQRCVCPAGYTKTASGTKCARLGAVLDVKQGERCDEIHERSYCSQGLICHTCPGDVNAYKCLRFLLSDEYPYLLSGSGSFIARHLILITAVAILSAVFTYTVQLFR